MEGALGWHEITGLGENVVPSARHRPCWELLWTYDYDYD